MVTINPRCLKANDTICVAGTLRMSASSETVMNSLTRTVFFSRSAISARIAASSSRALSSMRPPRRLPGAPSIWRMVREMLAVTAS